MSSKAFSEADGPPRATVGQSLETMRGLAIILVVYYHVILGLQLDSSHPLLLFAVILVDLHMPLFAFIAGYVYAFRPAQLTDFKKFTVRKFQRLLIPGIIAITLFAMFSSLVGNSFSVQLDKIWVPYFYSYAHFWFLQAIFLIFIAYGLVDALTGQRSDFYLLGISSVIYLAGPVFSTEIFSANSAFYLLPFFLLGVVFNRHGKAVQNYATWFAVIGLASALAATAWNIQLLDQTGSLSTDKHDLQSLVFGIGACCLAAIALPRVSVFNVIGSLSFSIYLYHVFFTSAARRTLYFFGIQDDFLHLAFGMAAGVALPALMHFCICHSNRLSQYILGTREASSGQKSLRPA